MPASEAVALAARAGIEIPDWRLENIDGRSVLIVRRFDGFLYSGHDGWQLSPAYDLNPVPIDVKPRFLMTAIDLDNTSASIELALEAAEYFMVDGDRARAIAKDVVLAVADWRTIAAEHKLSPAEIERMSTAFEHNDLEVARGL